MELEVQEAYTRDVGRGIVRIDYETMDALGIPESYQLSDRIVEVKGKGRTVARCLPLYPSDEDKGIIRMDGLIRNNARADIGEQVVLRKVSALLAKSATIVPLEEYPEIDLGNVRNMLEAFAVTKGDVLMTPYHGVRQAFLLVDLTPMCDVAIVTMQMGLQISKRFPDSLKDFVPWTIHLVGGLHAEAKRILSTMEFALERESPIEKLGSVPPKGIIVDGPSGTGKTLLIEALIYEWKYSHPNTHVITFRWPDILSKYLGETEKRIRDIFREARKKSPSIIYIDNINSIGKAAPENATETRILQQLVDSIDALGSKSRVLVIATTNKPENTWPDLTRSGRIDVRVTLKNPDMGARLEILRIHSKEMRFGNDVDLGKLASMTDGFVGADLERLCREAARIAVEHQSLKPSGPFDQTNSRANTFTEKGFSLFMEHSRQHDGKRVDGCPYCIISSSEWLVTQNHFEDAIKAIRDAGSRKGQS